MIVTSESDECSGNPSSSSKRICFRLPTPGPCSRVTAGATRSLKRPLASWPAPWRCSRQLRSVRPSERGSAPADGARPERFGPYRVLRSIGRGHGGGVRGGRGAAGPTCGHQDTSTRGYQPEFAPTVRPRTADVSPVSPHERRADLRHGDRKGSDLLRHALSLRGVPRPGDQHGTLL